MTLVDYVSLYTSSSAVVIAVLAIVVTLQPSKIMHKYKSIWLAIFIFFGVTAIGAIILQQDLLDQKELVRVQKERDDQRKQADRESYRDQNIAFLKGQLTTAITLLSTKSIDNGSKQVDVAKQLSESFDKFTMSVKKPVVTINEPVLPLKQRALKLSDDIISFVRNRRLNTPQIDTRQAITKENMMHEQQLENIYYNETIRLYEDHFQVNVMQIHDELKEKGLSNMDFDGENSLSTNEYLILDNARNIASLANRLP